MEYQIPKPFTNLVHNNMNYHDALKKIEDHVILFFREHPHPNLFFHNLSHTREVAENTKMLADHYQLDDHAFFIVCAAAWFHDTGQLIKHGEGHEQRGAELAQEYLHGVGISEEDIAAIKKCILATTMPQQPETLSEKIIGDADLFNLGTESFWEQNKRLRKEMETVSNVKIDGTSWRASSISILENHSYHTDYCTLLLNKKKSENLDRLKNRQEEKLIKKQEAAALIVPSATPAANPAEKKIKIRKKDRPERGIETMFRISASKNVRISEMADNKAHIMISVNSIIISVVLGLIIKSLDQYTNLILPTIILLIVNVATIIFSVLATRPKIADGIFTKEQVANKSVNLLYFGSYYNMELKDYEEGVQEMMKDGDFLYSSLTKDTFWQGKVLGRKYRLLRISYTIFLFGIVISVLAFTAAIIFSR
jgi:predicted metal-dependent HD superfamily phosphohydrolase